MVIYLKTVPDEYVVNVIKKMSGTSLKNARLSSRFINQFVEKNKKSIKICLPEYKMILSCERVPLFFYVKNCFKTIRDIFADTVSLKFTVKIEKKNEEGETISQFSFVFRQGELHKTRSELSMFIFDTVIYPLNINSKVDISKEDQREGIMCRRLIYHPRDTFVNQCIKFHKPRMLMWWGKENQEFIPCKILEKELLSTLRTVEIWLETEEQIESCIDELAPLVRSFSIYLVDETLNDVFPTLNRIKNLINKIRRGCPSVKNEFFEFVGEHRKSVTFSELLRPFRDITHLCWKSYGQHCDKYAFMFIRIATGSTLVLYIEENLSVVYKIVTTMTQFLEFYSTHSNTNKVCHSLRRRRQLNFIRKQYFSNK